MKGMKIFTPEYYDRLRELEDASWWNAAMRDVMGLLLSSIGLPETGLLLDVGCGSGQSMRWFRDRWTGWRTVGLDVAVEGLRFAHSSGEAGVFCASALNIPLEDGSVDAVITLDVLQHLPLDGGDMRGLGEIRRVLRPGGLAFIRTNAQTWPRAEDDPEHNFQKYSVEEVRRKLVESHFKIHRLGRLNALLGLAEIPRDLRARRYSGKGYVGLLAEVPRRNVAWHLKRQWLRAEGSLVAAGLDLPLGRSLVAVVEACNEVDSI
jgi:SAM-dependent methyltransferase